MVAGQRNPAPQAARGWDPKCCAGATHSTPPAKLQKQRARAFVLKALKVPGSLIKKVVWNLQGFGTKLGDDKQGGQTSTSSEDEDEDEDGQTGPTLSPRYDIL